MPFDRPRIPAWLNKEVVRNIKVVRAPDRIYVNFRKERLSDPSLRLQFRAVSFGKRSCPGVRYKLVTEATLKLNLEHFHR